MALREQLKNHHTFSFAIQNDDDFTRCQQIISQDHIENYALHPYYNHKNLQFFKDAVFFAKDDVLDAGPNQRDIFTRMAINPLNYGKVTVCSNGHIYANVNTPRLGKLGKDSLHDIVYKEITAGKSWRRTRKHVTPCKSCTFEFLCPPLSNYEYAIGRNNLCHI